MGFCNLHRVVTDILTLVVFVKITQWFVSPDKGEALVTAMRFPSGALVECRNCDQAIQAEPSGMPVSSLKDIFPNSFTHDL